MCDMLYGTQSVVVGNPESQLPSQYCTSHVK